MDEIELIADGDGVAVIGPPAVVEQFLVSEGLGSRPLELHRLGAALRLGSGAADAASTVAEASGRWVKLTAESVEKINKYGLMKGSSSHLSRGIVQAKGGQIKSIVEFVRGPGALLTSPAMLAGAAGMMSQLAMQQSMDEITDYLATIDEKVDDLLRAQKDAIFADMIGVDFVVQEALTVRSALGRVGEVTWSKVQGTAMTIARTQGYSLRQLDALAEKLERKADVDELAKVAQSAETTVHEWLAVLARCFQLQDAIAVLELDRVLDAEPDELDQYRLALSAARQNRRELIARSTQNLMSRIDAASRSSNATVVLNPFSSRSVVRSRNQVGIAVHTFHSYLEIDDGGQSLEATRWVDAAAGLKDQWVDAGAEGLGTAGRIGKQAGGRARSYADDFSLRLARGALRRQQQKNLSEEPPASE